MPDPRETNPEERLIALESKASYQDKLLEDLDEVVTEQQAQLERLGRQVEHLTTQVRAARTSESEGEEPPPPHY